MKLFPSDRLLTRTTLKLSSGGALTGSPILSDLSRQEVAEPWLLADSLPRDREAMLSLRALLDRHADSLGGTMEDAGVATEDGRHRGLVRLYRAELGLWLAGKAAEPPEGDHFGAGVLQQWLSEAPEDGHGTCSRYALVPWYRRPDLQVAFPDPRGRDAVGYLRWCRRQGVVEEALEPTLLAPKRSRTHKVKDAVNVVGFTGAVLGIGESSRRLTEAFRAADMPVLLHPIRNTANRQTFLPSSHSVGDVTVVVVNPDKIVGWWDSAGRAQFKGTYLVGLWAWETDTKPPGLEHAMRIVDEVWVTSTFTAAQLAPFLGYSPWVFRHPVVDRRRATDTRRDDGYFLVVMDYHSVVDRKNPFGALKAFEMAFAEGGGPRLLIKTINEHARPVEAARLRWECAQRSDVQVLDEYLSELEMTDLVGSATAVVSLHRAEGFGLVLADAMAMGVPVIATGYSGCLDFMNGDNSLLVDYELVSIGADNHPYSPDARWAEPDLEMAAEHMAHLHADEALRRQVGAAGQLSILATHAPEVSAKSLSSKMRTVRSRHRRSHPERLLRELARSTDHFTRRASR
ncbi:MAG: glycosyltransferase [Actinomycetia bacterium]|nr:glycosyltransferase [Actinomycetes bacterium]